MVTGTLPADAPLAGGLTLDTGAARRAVAETGGQLGLGAEDAADGIVQVAVAQMTAALRRVSVERGIDPREYTLVAFGGAGPLHAGLLLREAGLGGVLVPRYPGLFAAAGLVSADLRIDESSTVLRVLEPALLPELASWYRHTAARLTGQLRRDGIRAGRIRVLASADCRFVGQGYELNIGVAPVTQRGLASLAARFRARHLQTYGHSDPAQQVEVVTLRLAAVGALPRPSRPPCRAAAPRRRRRRRPGGCGRGCRGSGRRGRCRSTTGTRCWPATGCRARPSSTSWTRPRWCWPASGPGSTPAAACGWRRPDDGQSTGTGSTRSRSSCSARRCTRPRWRWAGC